MGYPLRHKKSTGLNISGAFIFSRKVWRYHYLPFLL